MYILKFNTVFIFIYKGRLEPSIFSGIRTSEVLFSPRGKLKIVSQAKKEKSKVPAAGKSVASSGGRKILDENCLTEVGAKTSGRQGHIPDRRWFLNTGLCV